MRALSIYGMEEYCFQGENSFGPVNRKILEFGRGLFVIVGFKKHRVPLP